MSLLYALTGSFDAPGGNVLFPTPASAAITGEELPAAQRLAPTLGIAERPLGPARWNSINTGDLYRAILESQPYPVRGLLGFGSNMLLAHADGAYGRNALAALEFYAHADMFMTPTAELADMVLPVASCFEREALKIGFEISADAQSLVQFRQAVVPPPGEARPDTDIIFDLADRLGLGAQFWNGDIDASYRQQLGSQRRHAGAIARRPGWPARALADQARQACRDRCDRQSTRFRHALAQDRVLYSQTFLDHHYAPLPEFVEPQMGPVARPDLAARFPLVLTSAKPTLFCQTQHRALPSLRRRAAYPEVQLHSGCGATPRHRRLATGLRSRRRTAAMRARAQSMTSSIRAWWSASTAGGRPVVRSVRPATIRSVRLGQTSTWSLAAACSIR